MIPIKNAKEIVSMREACATASRILAEISAMVRPGVTTGEIDAAAARLIREAGCKSAFYQYRLGNLRFPGHICISVNEEVVHGIGGPRKIQFGDLVKLDVGVIKNGWVGDTASTVVAGQISNEVSVLVESTEAALHAGIAFARAGNRLHDISHAIEARIRQVGFSIVRDFVGHGVGRKLHEEPQIPNYGKAGTGPKLKSGMVLAIEPMVNFGVAGVRILPSDGWTVVTMDGKPSAHFEHTVLVTSGDPEILTFRNKQTSAANFVSPNLAGNGAANH